MERVAGSVSKRACGKERGSCQLQRRCRHCAGSCLTSHMGLDDGVLGVVGRGGRGETAELFVLGREMEADRKEMAL